MHTLTIHDMYVLDVELANLLLEIINARIYIYDNIYTLVTSALYAIDDALLRAAAAAKRSSARVRTLQKSLVE